MKYLEIATNVMKFIAVEVIPFAGCVLEFLSHYELVSFVHFFYP